MASRHEDSSTAKSDPKQQVKSVEDKTLEDMGDVPDPDEDDLDDLDDMLDDFSATKLDSKMPEQTPAAGPGRSSTIAPVSEETTAKTEEEVLSDDDFAKQLQAGMAELMGEIDNSSEMQAQFESIFKELNFGAGEASPSPAGSTAPSASKPRPAPSSSSTGGGGDASFQETIRRTMERMQASGDQATAAAAAGGSDDFMAELLKQMKAGGLDGSGGLEGSEDEFSKMLLGMMEQLTNKDILYEPMKELNDKFPEWMEKNRDKISEEDKKRYELQEGYVKEIVARFEESTYADTNPADREYIVDRMQKMQAAGSPPPDLVGDMPSAQEALGAPDAESCNPQ